MSSYIALSNWIWKIYHIDIIIRPKLCQFVQFEILPSMSHKVFIFLKITHRRNKFSYEICSRELLFHRKSSDRSNFMWNRFRRHKFHAGINILLHLCQARKVNGPWLLGVYIFPLSTIFILDCVPMVWYLFCFSFLLVYCIIISISEDVPTFNINTMGASRGEGLTFPSGVSEFLPQFHGF